MKNYIIAILSITTLIGCSAFLKSSTSEMPKSSEEKVEEKIKLGAFSMSLSVKDLNKSKEFYETLGFEVLGGKPEYNYLIMKNENALIGLFKGMFEGNILTFNPGWNESGKNIESFDDIRKIEEHFKNSGISVDKEIEKNSSGPASLTFKDPDGNLILIDQHR